MLSKIKKYLSIFIILSISTTLLCGCASGKSKKIQRQTVLVASSHKKTPSWVTSIPEEKNYYYYVGTAKDSNSFDSGKEEAIKDALAQVVSTIGITVTASSTVEERYFAEQYTTDISIELITSGKAKLQDAEVKEIYYEKYEKPDATTFFRVWVLLRYRKEEIKREQERLNEILKMKYGEVKELEEKADKYKNSDMLFDAIISHINACMASLKVEDGRVFFDRNIRKATELLMKIQLKKFNEDQIGMVGKPLKMPLMLKVYYLKNDTEIPISNVPVRFTYRVPKTKTPGYKIMVFSDVTDRDGMASLKIEKIYEVNDNNIVNASININPYIKQLFSLPDEYQKEINGLRSVLSSKKTTFIFKSDTLAKNIKTALYFIQIDNNGNLLAKPVSVQEVYNILYEKRFLVKELDISPSSIFKRPDKEIWERLTKSAGKNTKRIIFGYVRIINYDNISGFYTSQAEANATLIDKDSEEVLRRWHIQRSGTGSTKELARLNVLREIGKSMGEIISNTIP